MICFLLSAVKAINTLLKTHIIFSLFLFSRSQVQKICSYVESCKSGGPGKCSLGTSVFILSRIERGALFYKSKLYEKLCFRLDSFLLREQLNQFTPKLNCKGGIINEGTGFVVHCKSNQNCSLGTLNSHGNLMESSRKMKRV